MATIIEFKASASGGQRLAPGGCEVIIFPGVRYERWSEAGEAAKKSRPRKRSSDKQHDHLEIPD